MNPMYQQPYPTWGYSPNMVQAQQQRLAEMEQQYPQISQQNSIHSMNQNFIKCRAVTSIDEAKASIIDLDGSINVFTDIGNKRIYTKQINLDGTASLKTYVLQEEPKAEASSTVKMDYVSVEELEAVCDKFNQQIKDLREDLELYEQMLNDRTKPISPKTPAGGKK